MENTIDLFKKDAKIIEALQEKLIDMKAEVLVLDVNLSLTKGTKFEDIVTDPTEEERIKFDKQKSEFVNRLENQIKSSMRLINSIEEIVKG